jgi:NitT/TauT family transport system substrate-binding protein
MKHIHFTAIVTLLIAPSVVFGACAPSAPASGGGVLAPTPAAPLKIKIAVLPVLDTLPMYVAQQQGYFEANGVEVAFVPVGSAPERDQIIAAGQADGMLNEVLTTMLANRQGVQVQTVRLARIATGEYPLFRIVAAKDSGITSVADLRGVEIGVSNGTIIEYIADRLLAAEGLAPGDIQYIAVPSIGDRLSLLGSGRLQAGVLPDPVASLALAGGATVVVDDTAHPEYGHSVITFRKAFIDRNPDAVRGFLKAYEQAVTDINADGTRWDQLLAGQKLVPPPLIGKITLPKFPVAGVPSESQFADVLDWARSKGLLDEAVYGDSVNASFLP